MCCIMMHIMVNSANDGELGSTSLFNLCQFPLILFAAQPIICYCEPYTFPLVCVKEKETGWLQIDFVAGNLLLMFELVLAVSNSLTLSNF